MPKSKPKDAPEGVEELVEEEAGVLDETEPTEADETPSTSDTELTESTEPTEETDETEAVGEEPESAAEIEEPVASADELTKTHQRIKELEAENARLKGETKPDVVTDATKRPTALDDFAKRIVPQTKQRFLDASPITVAHDGSVAVNPKGIEQQYDAIYTMTDHLVGSVLADHVSPILNNLAELAISLHNEVEIRDLRESSEGFKLMEKFVRAELETKDWATRRRPGAVGAVYQKLMELRNGAARPSAMGKKASAKISPVLRDLSAGAGGKPVRPSSGFKLTPEQEADFQDLLSGGWTGSREQYHAKWKARAEKAKAANRPIPKTYRSLTSSVA